jgi:flagellin
MPLQGRSGQGITEDSPMLGVNNNIGNLRAQNALSSTQRSLQTSLERLSTGIRINRSEDDAAGLLLRDRFGAQVTGLEEGIRNIQTASGMVQVAEEGLNRITDALQQMRQLALRAADDNLDDLDRSNIQQQISALLKEINDRAETTKYNGHRLLDGSASAATTERKASARVQANAILRDGSKLVDISLENRAAADTFGAVSQGTYQVKLVYSDEQRSQATRNTRLQGSVTPNNNPNAVESTMVTVAGYVNAFAGEPPASITRTLYDKAGVAHTAVIEFSNPHGVGNNTWDYTLTISVRGRWSSTPVSITGTGEFDNEGEFIDTSLTIGSASGVISAAVDNANGQIDLVIEDGTIPQQSLSFDFSAVRENHLQPVAVLTDLSVNGTPGAQTSQAIYTGNLDKDEVAGFMITTSAINFVDRVGTDHSTSLTFTKAGTNTWTYQVNGLATAGVWSGVNLGTSGTIVFRDDGAIASINGTVPAAAYVTVGDYTASGQGIALDLTAITQRSIDGTTGGSSVAGTQNGAAFVPDPTLNANWSGTLDSDADAGTTASVNTTWYDRTGTGHTVALTFTKSVNNAGLDDQWTYSISAASTTVWTAGINASGTIAFSTTGAVSSPLPFNLNILDGTTAGHDVAISFASIANAEVVPVAGAPDGSNWAASYDPTSAAGTSGTQILDGDEAVGFTASTLGTVWYDRLGVGHNVTYTFEKTGADQWEYSIDGLTAGGAWDGFNAGFVTGTLLFDNVTGNLTAINGGTVGTFVITVGDDTVTDQLVTIDFTGLTQLYDGGGGDTLVGETQNGSSFAPDPTLNANFSGQLSADAATAWTENVNVTWYDRVGAGHTVALALIKSIDNIGLDDQWSYTITSGPSGAWAAGLSTSGTLVFDAGGNLTSPAPFALNIFDDTTAGQFVTVGFGAFTNVRISTAAGTPDGSNFLYTPTGTAGTIGPQWLDADEAVGWTTTTAVTPWYDRLGNSHNVTISFQKLDTNEWRYTINGLTTAGTWNGANSANTTGTLSFNDAGALTAINGGPIGTFAITVGDDTIADQSVIIDFTGITQPHNGVPGNSTVQNPGMSSANGNNAGDPSTWATAMAGTQILSTAGTQYLDFNVVDRTGTDVSGFRISFTEVTPTQWSYQVLAPTASGFTGGVTGGGNGTGGGTIFFEPDEDFIQVDGGGSALTVRFEDGTPEDQILTVDLANVRMAKREDLTPTTADGDSGDDVAGVTVQSVYDREGNEHRAVITLRESSTPHEWSYTAQIEGGGAFDDEVTAYGTLRFKGADDVEDSTDSGELIRNSLTLSSFTGVHADGGLTYMDKAKATLTFAIQDGTEEGQSYTIDFSGVSENEQLDPRDPLAGTRWSMETNGSEGSQTSTVAMGGTLLAGAAPGASTSTGLSSWFDRTGRSHDVAVAFQKIADDDGSTHGEIWKYSLVGTQQSGVWTGDNEKDHDIIVQFAQGGASIESVNGQAGTKVKVSLGDGTAAGQDIILDFAGLSLGLVDAATQTPDGSSGTASTAATFVGERGYLTTGKGPTSFLIDPITDRTGTARVSGARIVFTQVGDSNTWNYVIKAPADSGFTGKILSGGSGQVTFQDDGDMIVDDPLNPASFLVKFDDGTEEGQTMTFTLEDETGDGLKMVRDNDLRKTTSDGGTGRDDPQVDAVIYWSDGGKAPVIISTLEGVSKGSKTYEAGGIILTVNTVSREDTGLVAFAKTLTYVSATTQDNALQFQVDADQGEVFRVGIERMTVESLFRRDHYTGEDAAYDVTLGGSISVATTLQAQDLIGQIDEALSIVGRANLNVGAFKNEFDRTLDLQRGRHTQMSNAYANINDADMAVEATNQSKRMILMQSATAMVAQSNTTSQFVLQLLR